MKLGYGLDESTDMGPYCTAAGRDKVAAWVQRGLARVRPWYTTAASCDRRCPRAFSWRPPSSRTSTRTWRSPRKRPSAQLPALCEPTSLDRSHRVDQHQNRSGPFCLHRDGQRPTCQEVRARSQRGKRWYQRRRAPAVRLLSAWLETQVLLWRGQEQDGLHEALLGRKDGDGPVGMRDSTLHSALASGGLIPMSRRGPEPNRATAKR